MKLLKKITLGILIAFLSVYIFLIAILISVIEDKAFILFENNSLKVVTYTSYCGREKLWFTKIPKTYVISNNKYTIRISTNNMYYPQLWMSVIDKNNKNLILKSQDEFLISELSNDRLIVSNGVLYRYTLNGSDLKNKDYFEFDIIGLDGKVLGHEKIYYKYCIKKSIVLDGP